MLPQLLKSWELDVSGWDDLKRQMAEAGLLKSPSRMVSHQRIENDTGEEYDDIRCVSTKALVDHRWRRSAAKWIREIGQRRLPIFFQSREFDCLV